MNCSNAKNIMPELLILFSKWLRAAILDFMFKPLMAHTYCGRGVDNSTKFGKNRTRVSEVMTIFVDLNRASAAKFHFWAKNRLRSAETKLGLKFEDNRTIGFEVIKFLVFFKMAAAAGGHHRFKNSKLWWGFIMLEE